MMAKMPDYASVRDFLLYSVSLPERALRSTSGVVGGLLRESASLLVPRAFQNSKTYSVLVRQMLDFMAEDIGGVARSDDPDAPAPVENFVARKTVGNFIEMAGLATLHLSPLMLLAVVSDVAYGSQAYVLELAEELKKEGVIDETSTIHHVDDLFEAIARTTEATATAFDTPPLSIDGLKQTISQTRESIGAIDPGSVLPQAEMQRLWDDIHEIARKEGVNPFAVSSAMTLYSLDKIGKLGRGALSTVQVAGRLFDRHVIDHYAESIGRIREDGFYTTVARTSGPYIDAVWQNFSTEKSTITEGLLSGKLLGQAWHGVRRWLGGSDPVEPEEPCSEKENSTEGKAGSDSPADSTPPA
ncbi:MAG: hypothetical protein JW818_18060 [Pirellulales bacterium]|nr:hypothetical protein [Pirellulales bacterium]